VHWSPSVVSFVVKIVPPTYLLRNGRVSEFNWRIVLQEPLAATGYFIRATSTSIKQPSLRDHTKTFFKAPQLLKTLSHRPHHTYSKSYLANSTSHLPQLTSHHHHDYLYNNYQDLRCQQVALFHGMSLFMMLRISMWLLEGLSRMGL